MSSYYEKDMAKFTLLSLPNWYGRVVVGDSQGNILTLSTKKWQEIVDWKIFATAISSEALNRPRPWHIRIVVSTPWEQWARPYAVHIWGEPLLGLEVICAFDALVQQWFLWTPIPLGAGERSS